MQELGGSAARQPAKAGRWKYSLPWTSCSVYKRGLSRGQDAICCSCSGEFEFSLVRGFEFLGEYNRVRDLWILWLLHGDQLRIGCRVVRKIVTTISTKDHMPVVFSGLVGAGALPQLL